MKHKLTIIALGCLIILGLLAIVILFIPREGEADVRVYINNVKKLSSNSYYTYYVHGLVVNQGKHDAHNVAVIAPVRAGSTDMAVTYYVGFLPWGESREFSCEFIFGHPNLSIGDITVDWD